MLLKSLAAGKPGGLIAEHGTGAGVGTAWLASGLVGAGRVVSSEMNTELADQVSKLFSEFSAVQIRSGDWHEVMANDEPYDLLFMDAGSRSDLDPSNWDRTIELVKVGGQVVMDDLLPLDLWPPEWDDVVDTKREFALRNPRAASVEVRTTATTSALVVTRIE